MENILKKFDSEDLTDSFANIRMDYKTAIIPEIYSPQDALRAYNIYRKIVLDGLIPIGKVIGFLPASNSDRLTANNLVSFNNIQEDVYDLMTNLQKVIFNPFIEKKFFPVTFQQMHANTARDLCANNTLNNDFICYTYGTKTLLLNIYVGTEVLTTEDSARKNRSIASNNGSLIPLPANPSMYPYIKVGIFTYDPASHEIYIRQNVDNTFDLWTYTNLFRYSITNAEEDKSNIVRSCPDVRYIQEEIRHFCKAFTMKAVQPLETLYFQQLQKVPGYEELVIQSPGGHQNPTVQAVNYKVFSQIFYGHNGVGTLHDEDEIIALISDNLRKLDGVGDVRLTEKAIPVFAKVLAKYY